MLCARVLPRRGDGVRVRMFIREDVCATGRAVGFKAAAVQLQTGGPGVSKYHPWILERLPTIASTWAPKTQEKEYKMWFVVRF